MTDPRYYQGNPIDKLIEEAAELIQQCVKLKRFGAQATDLFTGKSYDNVELLRQELTDVINAGSDALKWVREGKTE